MKEKKIGILTFTHPECDNYGAVLQAFALKKKINSMGVEADFINYNPRKKPGSWYDNGELQKKFLKRLSMFQEFNKTYLNLSKNIITSEKELKKLKYTHFIVGSDQVWNTSFLVASPVYFLNFTPRESKRISYAASVGTSADNPMLKKEYFEKYIREFDYISVREKDIVPFIQQYTTHRVKTVLDPSMLLTIDDYDELIQEHNEEPFIFLYFLKNELSAPLLLSFANMLSRKTGLKIIHNFVEMPNHVFKNDNKSVYYECRPQDFLWYIKNAEYVITNSFHGTIFSILYKKPFYTHVVQSMSSRVYNLLDETDLNERIISGHKNISSVTKEIDFSKADAYLKKGRKYSESFLKEALGLEKSD